MSRATSRKSTLPGNRNRAGKGVRNRSLRNGISTVLLLVLLFIVITVSASFSRRSVPTSSYCSSNLRTISSALEMYAKDNCAMYPPMLSYLSPAYLNTVPLCPSLGIDTYSCGYVPGKGSYYLCCVGRNHPELLDNMPACDSRGGIIAKPNPGYKGPDDQKNSDTATSVILLCILSVVSYLTFRKK